MKFSSVAALAAAASAAPVVERASAINDGVILNYALTLEHLEDTFYREGVAKFTKDDFVKAGAGEAFYGNLMEIAADEKTHVSFLTSALQAAKVTPVAACSYNFGYTDAKGFLAVANILEGVGVSAYLGAAQFIANKNYLTAAGSILTIEARHSAYLRDSQYPPQSPFPAPFDTPLSINEVYSLAALFITSCPSSNPKLPVMAFPTLALGAIATPVRPGNVLPITATKDLGYGPFYASFASINGPVSAKVTGSGKSFKVTVPKDAPAGQSYLILTKTSGAPTDDNTLAVGIIPVQSLYTYGWSP